MRDVGPRPLELPQQTHDAAERLGHGRALAAQGIELTLEGALAPAKLAQLFAEPFAFLLSYLERAPQAITLVDQRWDHVTELILALRQPAGRPLRVVDRLDLTHLAWCLRVGFEGVRGCVSGCRGVLRSEVDELVRGSRHHRRSATPALRRRTLHRVYVICAAPVQHHANFRVSGMAIAKVLVDRGLRSSDNDQIAC